MHSLSTTKIPVCLLIIVFLGSVEGTYAQTIKPVPVNRAFEKKLPDWLKETNVPAIGIGIIENGEPQIHEGLWRTPKGRSRTAEFNLSSRFPDEAGRRDSHVEVGDQWKVEPG